MILNLIVMSIIMFLHSEVQNPPIIYPIISIIISLVYGYISFFIIKENKLPFSKNKTIALIIIPTIFSMILFFRSQFIRVEAGITEKADIPYYFISIIFILILLELTRPCDKSMKIRMINILIIGTMATLINIL